MKFLNYTQTDQFFLYYYFVKCTSFRFVTLLIYAMASSGWHIMSERGTATAYTAVFAGYYLSISHGLFCGATATVTPKPPVELNLR